MDLDYGFLRRHGFPGLRQHELVVARNLVGLVLLAPLLLPVLLAVNQLALVHAAIGHPFLEDAEPRDTPAGWTPSARNCPCHPTRGLEALVTLSFQSLAESRNCAFGNSRRP